MSITEERITEAARRQDLVERARGLRAILQANAAHGDAERRLRDECIDAITEAGLFRMATPRRCGGHEATIRTQIAVLAELAKGDGSAAWVTMITTGCAWLVGLYPEAVQDEVFEPTPDARLAGAFAPTGEARRREGGVEIDGRWPYASGSLHAQWGICGIPLIDDTGTDDWGLALVPMSDVTVDDTWFTTGMRGTGSNTLVARELFVPDERVLSVGRAIGGDYSIGHPDEPLYRSSFVPVLSVILVAPILGLATAALDLVRAKAGTKMIAGTFYERQQDSPSFQYEVAEAASKIDSAYLFALRAADDIDVAASEGRSLDVGARARVRQDTGWAARQCREAVDLLADAHGASTFAEVNPLQRVWRDLHVASRHTIVLPAINQEIYGRALLGVTENATPFL